MSQIKTLDYSGLKDYEECPQRFKWHRLEKRKPVVPENSYYAIAGIVKQKLFELMFNEMWYLKGKDTAAFMENQAPKVFEETLKWARVNWNDPIAKLNKQQMLEEIKDGVKKGIKLIKEHRLISQESKSEIRLMANFGQFDLVGKVDFIVRHPKDKQNFIIDGKDTAKAENMDKYTDPRQLYTYSLLHKRNYDCYPDKLGFLFWRHDLVKYFDPTEGVEALEDWVKKSYWKMREGKFAATPSSKACFFCKYKHECPAVHKAKKIDDGTGVEEGEVSF